MKYSKNLWETILLLRKLMENSIRFPLTKLLNGSETYVSCPTALLVSPKLIVHEIVSASHGGESAPISEATMYLLGIGDEDESLTTSKDIFCSEHQKMNDLAYFLCVDQKLLSWMKSTLKRPSVICYL